MEEIFEWLKDSEECNRYCFAYSNHSLIYYHGDPYLVIDVGESMGEVVRFTVRHAERGDLSLEEQRDVYAREVP